MVRGTPCSTTSRLRNKALPHGPRPLRNRSSFWELKGLSANLKRRLAEANTLYIHYLALCESVSAVGGAHLWEHPEDPGQEPFPSIFNTIEMTEMETRTNSKRAVFDQCVFGCRVKKGTCITSTLDNIEELDNLRCPGTSEHHRHSGKSWGLDSKGRWESRRLQAYPTRLAHAFAHHCFVTLQRFLTTGTGPTGHLHHHQAVQRVTSYGSRCGSEARAGRVFLC